MLTMVSWLRYEYDGLNLLWIDEKYDGDDPPDRLDDNDPWRTRQIQFNPFAPVLLCHTLFVRGTD